jgi:hypothetical protein
MSDKALDRDNSAELDFDGPHIPHRGMPQWNWAALTPVERVRLARCLDRYVADYNAVFAREIPELVPPCWPQHPALAAELTAHFWLWASTHADPAASARAAVEFYELHLPRFRKDVQELLGQQPEECRAGRHRPSNWHTLEVRSGFQRAEGDDPTHTAKLLGEHHFGLTDLAQMP